MQAPNRSQPNQRLLQRVILIFFLFGFFSLKAQTTDPSQVETILKINPKTKTPLNKRQLKWAVKKGFETQNYDWQNNEVNLLIKKSIS